MWVLILTVILKIIPLLHSSFPQITRKTAYFFVQRKEGFDMPQRNHDPTDAMPRFSTTGTLRETLEELKDQGEFHITVEIGGEADAGEAISSG